MTRGGPVGAGPRSATLWSAAGATAVLLSAVVGTVSLLTAAAPTNAGAQVTPETAGSAGGDARPSAPALDTFPALAGRLQAALDSSRVALAARGAAAAVILPDGRPWVGVSGESHAGRPVTPGTLFEIGSVTKTFTAALLVQLHREGVLSLDDPIHRWVEDAPAAEGVTLRMLLRHTSGVADVMAHPDLIPTLIGQPGRAWSSREILAFVGEPDFPPGEGWHYSNTGFHLAGMAAEAATGRPLAELLRERLLEPLALPRTVYGATETPRPPRAHAFLDVNEDGTPDDLTALIPATSFLTAAGPAGAVLSTAEELARWTRSLHTGEVLDERGYEALTDLVDRPDGRRYGLGTLVDVIDDRTAYGHEGNSTGFSAAAWHLPDEGVTVVVLTNVHAVKVMPMTRALLAALPPRH